MITSVPIGLWDRAFDPATGALRNSAAPATNFVSSDSRGFKFRVTDRGARGSGEVEVAWRTAFGVNSVDDAPAVRTLSLLETGPATGVFVSRGVMLVTDVDDAAQPTNSGLPPVHPDANNRVPGQSNFRLRRVTVTRARPLDSQVVAEYVSAAGAGTITAQAPVFERAPDYRRRIRVHLVNVRTFARVPGGPAAPPIMTNARRNLIFDTFRSVYARCGIFAQIDEIRLEPPASCLGWAARYPGDPLASDPSVEGFSVGGGAVPPLLASASQTDLINAVRALPTFDANDVWIVCVSRLYRNPLPPAGGMLAQAAGGQAFPDAWTAGAASIERSFAFVAVASGITEFADPHECTHITTNLRNVAGGHFDLGAAGAVAAGPIAGRNLMNRFFLPNNLTVRNPKRLWNTAFTNTARVPNLVIPRQIDGIRAARFIRPY